MANGSGMPADTLAKAAAEAVAYIASLKTLCIFLRDIQDRIGRHDRCVWPTQAEIALAPRTQDMFRNDYRLYTL
jgi:hypothetical protein